jgi:putative oxidoreductase
MLIYLKNFYTFCATRPAAYMTDLSLFVLRLFVAQEFIYAGYLKWQSGLQAPEWFAQLPMPLLLRDLPAQVNWLSATGAELIFGAALLLGLASRLASAGLLFITAVAIYSVHFDLGWAGWNQIDTDAGQGFKVPLMLGIFLLVIFSQGAGRWSLDGLFRPQGAAPTRH